MPMLLTDWITIGTSGATVDGRKIAASDLEKMAKNYDPDVYTAVINVEHYYGNLGTVRQLRTAPGVLNETALQARICPNKYYLMQNAEQHRLFSSMEIMHDFLGKGEPYLTGLAATDSPASIGTSEIHFSKDNAAGTMRAAAVELPADLFADCREENSLIHDFFNRLGEYFIPGKKTKDDDDMTPEELKSAITDAIAPVTEKLGNLAEQVEKFAAPAEPETPETPNAPAAPEKPAADAAAFTEISGKITALTAAVNGVAEKLTAALGEKPGTRFENGQGPADGAVPFV